MKRIFLQIIIAAILSIFIGITVMLLMGGTLNASFQRFIWNIGYSMSIGLPLFANGYIFRWFTKYYIDWINFPVKSVLRATTLHLVYSSIVIFSVNWIWFILVLDLQWNNFWVHNKWTIFSEYIIFVIIASIMYAVSFFKAWKNQVIESEAIKREALSLKYQVLQDQVNPHFLFNSLNVLGSLIDIDISKAKEFTHELSIFYRELLLLKDQDIISLAEEIEFVKRYIYLQQKRFGESLQVDIIANANIQGTVIPLSLQMLVENAIKHNEISKANPLKIIIAVKDEYELVVENNLQPKPVMEKSSNTGLKNLSGRYEFLTGKEIQIIQNKQYFRVKIPLIKLEESNNVLQ